MSKDIVTLPTDRQELSVVDLKNQVAKIQAVMKSVMHEGTHFGTIPGIKTKFLWKPGAEKLCMTFRLIPKFTLFRTLHAEFPGHVTYEVSCELYHGPTNVKVGEGLGICSTLEKKYRYRNENLPTGVEVPKAWWNERKAENLPKILKNSGVEPMTSAAMKKAGLELGTGKIDGKFQIVYTKKIENPDIADVYNTVIKMAKKRAMVDATITALSVGDMFTQDPDAVGVPEPEGEDDDNRANVKESAIDKEASPRPDTARRTRRRASGTGE